VQLQIFKAMCCPFHATEVGYSTAKVQSDVLIQLSLKRQLRGQALPS